MKKRLLGSVALLTLSSSAFAEGEAGKDIITQLMGAIDTSTLVATVTSLGLIAVGVKFGEKGITFVKRLIGKI